MNLTIRTRLYVLAIFPLLFVAIGMMYFTRTELQSLNNSHVKSYQNMMMNSKQTELKSYMEIIDSILISMKNKNASLTEVIDELAKVNFGKNGYIYGYDSKGIRVLLGNSKKGLGDNYWDLKDHNGFLFIQDVIKKAKNGGGYSSFYFPKQGDKEASPKLAYSFYESQWDLVLGTGFYIDDIDTEISVMGKK